MKAGTARVVYTGVNPYQLFWKDRGYVLRSGQTSPELPIHECSRLMRTGFFAAGEGVWTEIMSDGKSPDPARLEGILTGRRVFLIGGGPSLKGFDLTRLDNEFTIAINHSFDFYPQARAVLFVDGSYAEMARDRLAKYEGLIFASFRCQDILPRRRNLYVFPQNNTRPGSTISEGLFTGKLSALCALNLALIMGASEIYLLGYDLNYQNGEHHWYGTAAANQEAYAEDRFKAKIPLFDTYKPWADRIFNCSATSAIKVFRYKDLDTVLKTDVVEGRSVPFKVTAARFTQSSIPVYPTSAPGKLQTVNGLLRGKRVFVLGSGPSLKGFDLSRLDGEETIAVNHTLEHYPKSRYHLFGDPRVYDYVKPIYDAGYPGLVFASHHANIREWERGNDRVFVFAKNWNRVTDNLEHGLFSDFSSGMEAVNLALVMGAPEIYLLGMDFCASDGDYYFYGRPKWMLQTVDRCEKLLARRVHHWDKFTAYRDRIFNCSAISKIKVFDYRDINEVLNGPTS